MSEWDARSADATQSTLDGTAGPCFEGHGPGVATPSRPPFAGTNAGGELSPKPAGIRAFQRMAIRGGPTTCASVLLGTTTAMVVAGLTVRLHRVFVNEPQSVGTDAGSVVGVALIALAVAIRIPQRFALWIYAGARKRMGGRVPDIPGARLTDAAGDRALYWIVLAVMSLAAGVATACLPLTCHLAEAAHRWMHAHFVWSVGPLAILHTLLILVAGLLPFLTLGLALSCVHHLTCPHGQWDPRATAWLLVGAAAGTAISGQFRDSLSGPDVMLVAASLPVLFVALLSATSNASWAQPAPEKPRGEAMLLPTSSDRWPHLLRASIVAVGGGAACAITVWLRALTEVTDSTSLCAAAMLAATGAGVYAGCGVTTSRPHSIGGFGVACAVAGVASAAGWAVMEIAATWMVPALVAASCVQVAAIGLATAYGRGALMDRVAHRSFAGTGVLARTLVCAGLTTWIVVPVAERLVGTSTTLVLLALSLLLLGGVLIIHEPDQSTRTRRLRLGAVFASIAVMIVVISAKTGGQRASPSADRSQTVTREKNKPLWSAACDRAPPSASALKPAMRIFGRLATGRDLRRRQEQGEPECTGDISMGGAVSYHGRWASSYC